MCIVGVSKNSWEGAGEKEEKKANKACCLASLGNLVVSSVPSSHF